VEAWPIKELHTGTGTVPIAINVPVAAMIDPVRAKIELDLEGEEEGTGRVDKLLQ
jgi:hypothetical protein